MRTIILLCCISIYTHAQVSSSEFTVRFPAPEKHEMQISLSFSLTPSAFLDVALPAWSPGYYQIMDFGKNVSSFSPENEKGEPLRWIKFGENTWRVYTSFAEKLNISYTVTVARNFVATAYVDTARAFIKPAAVFLYPLENTDLPVRVSIAPPAGWNRVATGLDSVRNNAFSFTATNYDILYDSPLLVGNLTELPPFFLEGRKHRFIGYNMGNFDGLELMKDLEKLIKTTTAIFEDIPYEHYTFIGLGPGNGGIEQLNSTAVAFRGESLQGAGRTRTLSFFTHEYFHHYNAKRIRPAELGPFDYNAPNRTNGLWVAEGLTAYYENIIMNRAGLLPRDEMLKVWGNAIASFQKNEGRHKQSLAESSARTWEDGPFGKKGETISYYEKGPLVGMVLDMRIRAATQNRKTLDDVMRILYQEFYKKQNRGFTDEEMISTCEKVAGTSLKDIFEYVYTTKEIDYARYFDSIGVEIDSNSALHIRPDLGPVQKTITDDLFRKTD